jgi:hypothetical protein
MNAAKYLIDRGIKKEAVAALGDEEMREMREKLAAGDKAPGTRRSTFHRGGRTPSTGFRIVNSPGPNIVAVCADGDVKLRVLRTLRRLQNEVAS